MSTAPAEARKRMSYDQRHIQLLDAARNLIRQEGIDTLTLARVAEHAGVTKPLVYQHFGTRAQLLVELYREFKERTYITLDAALENTEASLTEVSSIIADAYIDCIDAESTEVPGVGGALSGSAELERLRHDADVAFSARCRSALDPFTGNSGVPEAALYAILGAAEGLARALVLERIGAEEAREALAKVVAAAV